jgi:hypothetical protein
MFIVLHALIKSNYKNLVIVEDRAFDTNSEFLYQFESENLDNNNEEDAVTEENNNSNGLIVKKTTLENLLRETRENLYFEGASIDNYEYSKQEKVKKKLYIEDLYKNSLFIFVKLD